METLGKILKFIFITLIVGVLGWIFWSIVRSIIGLFKK